MSITSELMLQTFAFKRMPFASVRVMKGGTLILGILSLALL